MGKSKAKVLAREARHARVRKKVSGTPERPRLSVFRSLKYIYAQIIDDVAGTTIVSASSISPSLKKELKKGGGNIEAAKLVGKTIAEAAKEKGITQVVFDRGGYAYHGRVKAVAETARENGLQL
jgi:large subunit ribosomal protein L18